MLEKLKNNFLKEFKYYPITYLILALILFLAFFVRVYRVDQLLGFYFDQGRDALVIWNFWHKGDLFLVGPTTGIAGILRGPIYYYLIAPFYLLGGGNPVWPSVFLACTSVLAIVLTYYLGFKIQNRLTGIFAAVITSFSFLIILASRWLSNPTPMMLLSMILVWLMILVTEGKRWAWVVIAFVAGLSLFHFGSAGEIFYFPALIIFSLWQRKHWPDKKIFHLSTLAFLITALPLIIFDIRHGGILRQNIQKFLFEEGSFKVNFWDVARERMIFYYDVFSSKIFHWRRPRETTLLAVVAGYFLIFLPKLWEKRGVKILLLLLISPIIGLLFFQGNFGNIYDYYLTGYYLIFILLFAVVLGKMWEFWPGKLFILLFFFVFLTWESQITKNRITSGVDGPETIAFGNQKQAIDWIFEDADGREFNVDVYVPPVIPYAYDYLFLWYGGEVHGYTPNEDRIPLLYTLYEVDPPHPERLEAWLERQSAIGVINEEVSFGGITVQRRSRSE